MAGDAVTSLAEGTHSSDHAYRSILKHQFGYMAALRETTGATAAPQLTHQSTNAVLPAVDGGAASAGLFAAAALGSSSALMSQVPLTAGDDVAPSATAGALFPIGATDVNGQQVDMRKHNSWTMRLHEVSTPELAEVFAINAMAPAIINARLKSLMERDPAALKFIFNVSGTNSTNACPGS